jgi:hypothetical protein
LIRVCASAPVNNCATALVTVRVNITAVDDGPYSIASGTATLLDPPILLNDYGSGVPSSVTVAVPAGRGTVEIINGNARYTPNSGFFGTIERPLCH